MYTRETDSSLNFQNSSKSWLHSEDDLAVKVDFERKRNAFIMIGPLHIDDILWVLKRISSCSILIVHQWIVDSRSSEYEFSPVGPINKKIFDKRLYWSVDHDLDRSITYALKYIDKDIMDGWQPIISKREIMAPKNQIMKIIRRLGDFLNSENLGRNTNLIVPSRVLKNALINLPRADASFETLNKMVDHSSRPALIVAAGPSLTKQLPLLRDYQDYFNIIAVDGVWKLLATNEIIPDALVALDPTNTPSWRRGELNSATRLWADIGCDPLLIDSNLNHSILTYHIPEIGLLIGNLGAKVEFLRTGGSVATSAFSLAYESGASLIVLIGQDLALTGGKDHAEGYQWEYNANVLNEKLISGFDTDGYYGGRVRTEPQLLFYKNWYEDQIREIAQKKIIVNSTEGGARINGTLQIPFQMICEEARKMSQKKVAVNSNIHRFNSDYVESLIDQIEFLINQVRDMGSLAEEGKNLLGSKQINVNIQNLNKIDIINAKLKNYDKGTKAIINILGAIQFSGIKREVKRTDQPKVRNKNRIAIDKYIEIYDEIIRNCKYVENRLPRLQGYFRELINRQVFFIPELAEKIWAD